MFIADRLRQLREAKNLSQGDIEKRTGLLRCYVSRVENGHTVPALETLEKMARACEVRLYQLFYDGSEEPPSESEESSQVDWASRGKGQRLFVKISRLAPTINESNRSLLLYMAQKMARGKRPRE